MKYYSKKMFYFMLGAQVLFAVAVFLYWRASSSVICAVTVGEQCEKAKINFNLFVGLIPLLFAVLSCATLFFQQKGHKKFGYLAIPLVLIALLYGAHFAWYSTRYSIKNILFIPGPPEMLYFWIELLLLLIVGFTPFYALARMIKK